MSFFGRIPFGLLRCDDLCFPGKSRFLVRNGMGYGSFQAPFPAPAGPNGFGLPAVRRKGAASVAGQIQQSAGGVVIETF